MKFYLVWADSTNVPIIEELDDIGDTSTRVNELLVEGRNSNNVRTIYGIICGEMFQIERYVEPVTKYRVVKGK